MSKKLPRPCLRCKGALKSDSTVRRHTRHRFPLVRQAPAVPLLDGWMERRERLAHGHTLENDSEGESEASSVNDSFVKSEDSEGEARASKRPRLMPEGPPPVPASSAFRDEGSFCLCQRAQDSGQLACRFPVAVQMQPDQTSRNAPPAPQVCINIYTSTSHLDLGVHPEFSAATTVFHPMPVPVHQHYNLENVAVASASQETLLRLGNPAFTNLYTSFRNLHCAYMEADFAAKVHRDEINFLRRLVASRQELLSTWMPL